MSLVGLSQRIVVESLMKSGECSLAVLTELEVVVLLVEISTPNASPPFSLLQPYLAVTTACAIGKPN